MCHIRKLSLCPDEQQVSEYTGAVSALRYANAGGSRRIALLPDIYGVTPFYKGLASLLSDRGAIVYLVDPWHPFGELPEMTREAAWARRHHLRDRAFCDELEAFLGQEGIDTIVGFCIGGNFVLELVRRGYRGTCCALYPLPWGMANEDGLQPPFEYMDALEHEVTILMGEQDPLAGEENVHRLRETCARNPAMDLHLYEASGHGFLADVDSDQETLRSNARAALDLMLGRVFPTPAPGGVERPVADIERLRSEGVTT